MLLYHWADTSTGLAASMLLDGGQSSRGLGLLRKSCYGFSDVTASLSAASAAIRSSSGPFLVLCVTPSRFRVLRSSGPLEAIRLCVFAQPADIRRGKLVLLASVVIGSTLHFSL